MSEIEVFNVPGWYLDRDETTSVVLLTDHIAAPEAVKATVKPLEWVAGDGITADKLYFTAKSVVGTYWVIECQWGLKGEEVGSEYDDFDSDEAAKAAAQADYERRVLSAIVPSPALEANQQVIETLRSALELSREWIGILRGQIGDVDMPMSDDRDPSVLEEAVYSKIAAALTHPTQEEVKPLRILNDPCVNKLAETEPFFVLLGRDPDASQALSTWITYRLRREGRSEKTAAAEGTLDAFRDYQDALTPTRAER